MTKARYSLGPSSRVTIRTRATGVLARLAHDLEIASAAVGGTAETDDGEAWVATAAVRAGDLRVAGTLHGDRLDAGALSRSDRAEIERRVRADVLANAPEVVVEGAGATRRAGEIAVTAGRKPASFPVRLEVVESSGGRLAVTARATLALSRLGAPEIKGPLGAFRVRDEIEVVAELELVPA